MNVAHDAAFQMLDHLFVRTDCDGAGSMCGAVQRCSHGPHAKNAKYQKEEDQTNTPCRRKVRVGFGDDAAIRSVLVVGNRRIIRSEFRFVACRLKMKSL